MFQLSKYDSKNVVQNNLLTHMYFSSVQRQYDIVALLENEDRIQN